MKQALFVFHNFSGGAERLNIDLINALHGKEFHAKVLCFADTGFFKDALRADITKVIIPSGLAGICFLYNEMRRAQYVMATVELKSAFCAALFAAKKTTMQVHKDITLYAKTKTFLHQCLYKSLLKWCIGRTQKTLCIGPDVHRELSKLCPKQTSKLHLVYNFYNDALLEEQSLLPLPSELTSHVHASTILSVGRLESQKNFILLLEAVKLLKCKAIFCNCIILGEGSQRAMLEKYIQEHELEDDVLLPGAMSPYGLMENAGVFCQSSDYEGFPTVVLEALALGCTIVSTNTGQGVSLILQDGQYGTLTPCNDAQALAMALEKSLQNTLSETQKQLIQQHARQFSLTQQKKYWSEALFSYKEKE